MLLWVLILPWEGLRAGWRWWDDPEEASSGGSWGRSWPSVALYLPEWPNRTGPPVVPAGWAGPLYTPPSSEEGRVGATLCV